MSAAIEGKTTGADILAGDVSSRLLYMGYLLDVLRSAGGTLPSTDVFKELNRSGLARKSDIDTVQPSGETRFAKEVRFARLELVEASLLECPDDGIWSLSETGWSTFLTPEEARALVRARRHGRVAARSATPQRVIGGPTRGPRPTSYSAIISRDATACAFTYILQFGASDIWKIGHASDIADRLSQVNKHVPHEYLGQQWRLFAKRLWPDALAAYRMEQRLLGSLTPHRTVGERVRCTRSTLVDIWRTCLVETASSRSHLTDGAPCPFVG